MVELVGLYSSFHVGKIQVSVAEPIKIGQAKSVKVRSVFIAKSLFLVHYPYALLLLDCFKRECSCTSWWWAVAAESFHYNCNSQWTSKYVEKSVLMSFLEFLLTSPPLQFLFLFSSSFVYSQLMFTILVIICTHHMNNFVNITNCTVLLSACKGCWTCMWYIHEKVQHGMMKLMLSTTMIIVFVTICIACTQF